MTSNTLLADVLSFLKRAHDADLVAWKQWDDMTKGRLPWKESDQAIKSFREREALIARLEQSDVEPDEGIVSWTDTKTGETGTLCTVCGHDSSSADEPPAAPTYTATMRCPKCAHKADIAIYASGPIKSSTSGTAPDQVSGTAEAGLPEPPSDARKLAEITAFVDRLASDREFRQAHAGEDIVELLRSILHPEDFRTSVTKESTHYDTARNFARSCTVPPDETSVCVHDLQREDRTVRMHQENGQVGWKCTICSDVWMPAESEDESR